MKTKLKKRLDRFELRLVSYGNSYYIDRTGQLEKVLARKPRALQLDLIGDGEIPADFALLLRSVLLTRSPKTQLITNARSSLQGGSVLIWLLGERRQIRDDASVFFRRIDLSEDEEVKSSDDWKNKNAKYRDSYNEVDPEDATYVRMLQFVNEFLPVDELAGRMVGTPVLRQFGLIENERVDNFLTTAFGKAEEKSLAQR